MGFLVARALGRVTSSVRLKVGVGDLRSDCPTFRCSIAFHASDIVVTLLFYRRSVLTVQLSAYLVGKIELLGYVVVLVGAASFRVLGVRSTSEREQGARTARA